MHLKRPNHYRLSGVGPGVLQHCESAYNSGRCSSPLTTLLGSDSVDRVIRVTLSSDSSADGNGGRLTLDGLSIGINVSDLELDRGVVLGSDQSVYKFSLHPGNSANSDILVAEQCRGMYKSTRTPLSFSTYQHGSQISTSSDPPTRLISASKYIPLIPFFDHKNSP